MYRFRLIPQLRADLARLERLRERLDRSTVLPRRWNGRLRRDLEAEAVAASTAMEGVPVTVEEVRRILAGDRPPTVKAADARLVEGYRDAMSYVLRRADDRAFRWQPELILAVHDRVMAGAFAQAAGRFRTRPAHVAVSDTGARVYDPPAPDRVPRLVDELTAFIERRQGRLAASVLAALIHVRLAGIHPFADGNGRTARVLAALAMHRGGYTRPEFTSLEEWWGSHRATYSAAFACLGTRFSDSADVTPFVAAHVRAQRQQVDALSLRLAIDKELWTLLEDVVTEDLGAAPRLADALYDGFFGRPVTNRYYREMADVSSATATMDLAKLEAAGLLTSSGRGRSTEFTGSAALITRIAAACGAAAAVDQDGPTEARRAALIQWLALNRRGRG